jgi:hypothetical protein
MAGKPSVFYRKCACWLRKPLSVLINPLLVFIHRDDQPEMIFLIVNDALFLQF